MLFTEIFLLAIFIYIIGLLYGIFWLKEIKVPVTSGEENGGPQPPVVESKNGNGVDNMAFQEASNAAEENKNGQTNAGPMAATIPEEGGDAVAAEPRKKKNFCLEFFDPTLALACIEVVRRKRENHKHVLIWLFILSYIVIAGTVQGNIFIVYWFRDL